MDLNNLFLFFILVGFGLFFYKFLLSIVLKKRPLFLVDNQFKKPQAFHENPISIAGGTGIFYSFIILIFYFFFNKELLFLEYLLFCSFFYFLGLADDLKIYFKPKIRLVLMILFLASLVRYSNFYIEKTGIEFLNVWLENYEIFSLLFICLCFLFIINGANLIDGYNGLLGFHSLIILMNLFVINYLYENKDLANFILFNIIILLIFIKFNFPKAKVFLGDSGSYFLGTFIAITTIKTSILVPSISPFYFCILLFYLFFEVFFSFFRKLIKEKKSPIYPDQKHLHMILYKILLEKNKNKLKSNYSVSILINSVYFILTIPAILMMKNGIFCKYYSIIFFIVYIFTYKMAYNKIKNI